MLIAATIMPIVFGLLEIPAAVAPDAVIASACATLGTFLAIALWVGGAWRLWASCGLLSSESPRAARWRRRSAISISPASRRRRGSAFRSKPSRASISSSARRSGACCPRSCSSRSSAPWKRSAMGLPSSRARGARAGRQTSGLSKVPSLPTALATCFPDSWRRCPTRPIPVALPWSS